jgi:hypothetical protein
MLLQDSSPRFLVDHCHRSLELALLIAAASGADLDVEVLHAGMLLPDLVLTPRFHSAALRFAVASADAARDLVRAHGMEPRPGPTRCGIWPCGTPPAGSRRVGTGRPAGSTRKVAGRRPEPDTRG